MKKIITINLILILLIGILTGCSIDDPGYVIIDDSDPVSVEIEGNPEINVVDTDGDIITIDSLSGALVTIDFPHQELHEGNSYFTEYVDVALVDDATIIMAFKTMVSPTQRAHMTAEFSTLVGGDFQVWEDPIWTNNTGSTNPIINRKREAVMVTSGLLEDKTATPTFTATGNILVNVTGLNTDNATELHHFYSFTAQGRGEKGGARDSEELILKPDTQYAIVFTADGNNNRAQIILNWYEHTDIN